MSVPAIELVDPLEFGDFMQGALDKFGDDENGLMKLLLHVTTMKAVLEDALGLEEPLRAVIEHVEEGVDG